MKCDVTVRSAKTARDFCQGLALPTPTTGDRFPFIATKVVSIIPTITTNSRSVYYLRGERVSTSIRRLACAPHLPALLTPTSLEPVGFAPQIEYHSTSENMSSRNLSETQATFPSDSENYDANHSNSPDSSDEPTSTSSSPMILYSPPTVWGLLRGAAINLLLPFINGLMLGFGELFAHEAAFRLGWSKTKVRFT